MNQRHTISGQEWRLLEDLGTLSLVPGELRSAYGDPPLSALLFVHAALD